MVRGSPEQREYMDEKSAGRKARCLVTRPPCTSLPEGYRPIRLNGWEREAPYVSYLRSRGVSDHTIRLYRMGYVDTGALAGRVVVPSFDAFGSINFWSARSIDPEEHRFRYRLPMASKDIVSNEHMVDWGQPVYLVEGIFDEVAIGPQAISLYGKFLPARLATKLVEKRPPMIHVCLDSDARMDARAMAKRLMGYDLRCSIVDLDGKDPGSVPSEEIQRAVMQAQSVTSEIGLLRARGAL